MTDLYFNDDEDVYTTIEVDKPPPTPMPTSRPTPVPQPTTTAPTQDRDNLTIVNATITWITPEEAMDMGLPDAVTFPPKDSSAANSGSESQQVEKSDPDQASQAVTNGGSESQIEGTDQGQASQTVTNGESEGQ